MQNTKEDKIQFSKIMYGLAGNFGGEITKHDLILRFEVLKDYSLNEIKQAGLWLLKNRAKTFPAVPTTKEIIDAIEPTSSLTMQAGKQVDIIFKYLKFYGRDCQHTFKHPVTQHLMQNRWSFYQLGNMTSTEILWFRKNFVDAWLEMVESQGYNKKLLNASSEQNNVIEFKKSQKNQTKKEAMK